SRVGIAFPDSVVDLPATTQKDLKDVEWAIANKIDYVAVSFVKNARDLSMLREISSKHGGDIRLIAKIERRTALENIEEILDASDGLMVARGDLGLELPLEKVPLVQKQLIAQANYRGIPVIVATQMLHSMITSTRPTRAEVTDIAFAVMSGADAVMLSEETAIGEHPRKAVEYLGKIAAEADRSFVFDEYKLRLRDADRLTVPDAVAYAACAASIKVSATAIIACTETGTSARLVAKYRPQEPLYGVSTSEAALRRMSLYWGVKPLRIGEPQSHQDELEIALESVKKDGNFPKGSRAVVTGGLSVRSPGATTMLEIKEL
ncbi:MAG: pyruvate kinase, partial [Proteobacteria bacterium]